MGVGAGVVRTLYHRADTVVTEESDRIKEKDHIDNALNTCGYPQWALDMVKRKNKPKQRHSTNKSQPAKHKTSVSIPFVKGLTEPIRRVFSQYNIQAHVKPTNTLRQLLCHPKDKAKKELTSGPIYHISCDGSATDACGASYIGETERTLKTRFQEHCRPSSASSEVCRHIHQDFPNHSVSLDNTKILDREPRWFERGVKEAVHIRSIKPTLNKDGGRHQLPHIWDRLIDSHMGSSETPIGQ